MPVQWVGMGPDNCPEFLSLLARDAERAVGTAVSLESGLAAKGDWGRVYLEQESSLLLLLRGERMAQVWSEISYIYI